jgi:hypothetical protein
MGAIFDQRSIKKDIEKKHRKSIAKKHEHYTQSLPKCSQNRCRNSQQINAKTGTEKDKEHHKKSCFLKCKNMQIHWKGHQI